MRKSNDLKLVMAMFMALSVMPLLSAGVSAEVTTIYADLGRCRTNVHNYQVQLRSFVQGAPNSDFPDTVTIQFADGFMAEATSHAPVNIVGTRYYQFYEERDVDVVTAIGEFDTAKYPDYSFTVTARPCRQAPEPTTYTVAGVVTQHGNSKAVADLDVCVEETGACTVSNGDGSFNISGLGNGTYTLNLNGQNWKEQSITVTVADGDVYLDIVQRKGGGN